MEIVWEIIGIILCFVGIVGCFIPILPGPPISYIAILILHFLTPVNLTTDFLIFWLIVVILVTAVDFIMPMIGAKKMGGSSYGLWGCGIGFVIGFFIFPPFGFLLFAALGALIGEMMAGKSGNLAFKAALGSFLGFIAGTILKLVVSSFLITYYIIELSKYYFT